jgi:ABC-type sugar transport system ATPase subunit
MSTRRTSYHFIRLAQAGLAIALVSSELPEIITRHQIIVLSEAARQRVLPATWKLV